MMKKFRHLVLAGTFDHFHLGHQYFLTKALKQAHFASLGVASQPNPQKTHYFAIQNFKTRSLKVKAFLAKNKLLPKTRLFSLENP